MATAVVSASSELKRKKWIMEGLLQAKSQSFWSEYTGNTKESMVYQRNDTSAKEGHKVVFDMDGNLSGKAYKNKTTAFGQGEQKRKFSDTITVDRYRLPVDNGDAFDGVDVGNLAITQHSDSRAKLADLYIRWKDQMLFDTAQGYIGSAPTHILQLGAAGVVSNWYTELTNIELALRTGTTYLTSEWDAANVNATRRAPLPAYRMADGRRIWLMLVDPFVAAQMRTDSNVQGILQQADNRGDSNRLIKGLMGKIGALHIVEAEIFFGAQDTNTAAFEDTKVEIAGLRRYDVTNNVWQGDSSFDDTATLWSRCPILGATALQVAMGKMPDYKWQPSEDFGIKSESAVEFWTNSQKINLTAEMDDYDEAKVASLDYGVVVADLRTQA